MGFWLFTGEVLRGVEKGMDTREELVRTHGVSLIAFGKTVI